MDADKPKTCSCCAERDKQNEITKPGRTLNVVPSEVTSKEFRKKDKPLYLCHYCDGDALESALQEHAFRTEG